MNPSSILFEEISGKEGNLGLVTLNRPQALNALTHEMIISLHQQLIQWENDPKLKAVVICAAPGRAFCAGGDLRLVYDKHQVKDSSIFQFFRDEYRLNHYIFHYTKPYISILNGITMGGGAGISINGSHCIATENLVFAMPETGIGFFPDVGGSYFLSRLPYGLGFYLGLTGARLSADDCIGIRLMQFKSHSSNIPDLIKALADTPLGGNAREKVNHVLSKFQQSPQLSSLTEQYPFISKYFIKHDIEEIMTALDSHKTPWHQETLGLLKTKSPTSLKITLKEIHEGARRDFGQCMQMEYHLMWHFIQEHDFFEGIRAVLIDKTQNPSWLPGKLNEISQEDVESFFIPLGGEAAQLLFT